MTAQYLDFNDTAVNLATLWDCNLEGPPGKTEVFAVTFEDGSIGLLPQHQIDALTSLVEYSWEDEVMDWNQNCNAQEKWVSEPYFTDNDEDNTHIVHHLASLRIRTAS